jgi:hypothetical protein
MAVRAARMSFGLPAFVDLSMVPRRYLLTYGNRQTGISGMSATNTSAAFNILATSSQSNISFCS